MSRTIKKILEFLTFFSIELLWLAASILTYHCPTIKIEEVSTKYVTKNGDYFVTKYNDLLCDNIGEQQI